MKKVVIISALLLFIAFSSFAQLPIDLSDLTKDNVFDKLFSPIMSTIVLLTGLLSSYIPALKKINKATLTLVTSIIIGIVSIVAFKSNITEVIISIFVAVQMYNGLIRQAVKEPLVKEIKSAKDVQL